MFIVTECNRGWTAAVRMSAWHGEPAGVRGWQGQQRGRGRLQGERQRWWGLGCRGCRCTGVARRGHFPDDHGGIYDSGDEFNNRVTSHGKAIVNIWGIFKVEDYNARGWERYTQHMAYCASECEKPSYPKSPPLWRGDRSRRGLGRRICTLSDRCSSRLSPRNTTNPVAFLSES